jgi:hypothetical protein
MKVIPKSPVLTLVTLNKSQNNKQSLKEYKKPEYKLLEYTQKTKEQNSNLARNIWCFGRVMRAVAPEQRRVI